MKNWMLAIRPKTLLASLAPIVLGLAVDYVENFHFSVFNECNTHVVAERHSTSEH